MGSKSGTHGGLVDDLRQAIVDIATGWNNLSAATQTLALQIESTQTKISAANVKQKQAVLSLQIQSLQFTASAMAAVADVAGACSPSVSLGTSTSVAINIGACLSSITKAGIANDLSANTGAILGDLKALAGEEHYSQVAAAFQDLESVSIAKQTEIANILKQLGGAVSRASQKSAAIKDAETAAGYYAAKAGNADFYKEPPPSNTVVSLPVNTVLNRQYDIARIRYGEAQKNAKYLSFVARRAIEQRIGIRMSSIADGVGPLEAPKIWADDICEMVGINYDELRTANVGGSGGAGNSGGTGGTGGKTKFDPKDFAKRFVGDYVDKLDRFMEYYNIKYPSHEGDDLAILSVREDLMGSGDGCIEPSRNLLFFSGRLGKDENVTENGVNHSRGWVRNSCDANFAGRCLQVVPVPGVGEPPFPFLTTFPGSPDGAATSSITWLHDAPMESFGGFEVPAGTPPPDYLPQTEASKAAKSAPAASVFQIVHLKPGSYVLSWWDLARKPNGDPTVPADNVGAYQAHVLNGASKSVASRVAPAPTGTGIPSSDTFSKRQRLQFTVTEPQDFKVVFTASVEGSLGSVMIAAVQLEQASSAGAEPSQYVATESSALVRNTKCSSRTPSDLQKAFDYACEDGVGCYYQLRAPFALSTEKLSQGRAYLDGKLAAGNYNFRHVDIALNLVGTAVHDCGKAGSPACFGSGYVEYSLFHDAYQVQIYNAVKASETFSFGSASINHAKALSLEKYITNPMSSSDKGFLDQPSIKKPEYRGRPLDGTYRMRIWDSPSLKWANLEDVQIVLTYRYWAPITISSDQDPSQK